jgi:hypothetical protein
VVKKRKSLEVVDDPTRKIADISPTELPPLDLVLATFADLREGTINEHNWHFRLNLLGNAVKESNSRKVWVDELVRITRSGGVKRKLRYVLDLLRLLLGVLDKDRDDESVKILEAYEKKLLWEQYKDQNPGVEGGWTEDDVTGNGESIGGPDAEQKLQPSVPDGVKLSDVPTKELMQELVTRPDAREETRQTLLWDIADIDRPKWKDKEENPDRLPPELRYAPAPVFLKIAWADEIDAEGRIYTQRVRHSDRKLLIAVERYIDNRKDKDLRHAKDLTLVTGTVPPRPTTKTEAPRKRIAAPRP